MGVASHDVCSGKGCVIVWTINCAIILSYDKYSPIIPILFPIFCVPNILCFLYFLDNYSLFKYSVSTPKNAKEANISAANLLFTSQATFLCCDEQKQS